MEVLTDVDPARIRALIAEDHFFWIDLVAPDDDQLAALGEALDLHPLALEDTREMGQRPKVDRFGDSALIVFFTAMEDEAGEPRLAEIHLHLSGSWLATVRRDPCDALDALRPRLVGEGTKDEAYLVYRVLDALTDRLYPVVDRFERDNDALEAAALNTPTRHLLARINDQRQLVQRFARRVGAQGDHFMQAVGELAELPGLAHGRRAYFRDIADHLLQLASEFHRQADDVVTVTTMYFNANANRLTLTATRLTVLATFFLVWTLVTSFFGQNFKWLTDRVDTGWTFLVFGVGGLVIPTLVTAVYFWQRRRDWL
jgi:magnesium transporter